MIGLIGRGRWGQVYAATLRKMGVEFWHAGSDVDLTADADGVIIAAANETHAPLAEFYMDNDVPVLIEKPVTLGSSDAKSLLATAVANRAIAFAGHTRLYSNAWREFRETWVQRGVQSVYACAGAVKRDGLPVCMDWGPHMVAMCIDIGFDPRKAHMVFHDKPTKLSFIVNGKYKFVDVEESPSPLEVLVREFMEAIEDGQPDYRALQMNVQIMQVLEEKQRRMGAGKMFPHAMLGGLWH